MLTAEMPRPTEVLPVPNVRRQNRETFRRLFQGFVADYGTETGKKIVKHLVDQAGGYRIRVPGTGPDPLFGCSSQFRKLWISTCREFGRASGRAIMQKLIIDLGDQRVWFPDYEDLYLWERNEKIRNQYYRTDTGDNAEELSIRWSCCPAWIRRIVRGEED